MANHVVTFKLSDGTTQTSQVPAGSSVDAWVAHIKSQGGFWTDRTTQGTQALGPGSLFVNWDQVVSVSYTS